MWQDEIEGCFYQKAIHRLRPKSVNVLPAFMLRFMRFAKEFIQIEQAKLIKYRKQNVASWTTSNWPSARSRRRSEHGRASMNQVHKIQILKSRGASKMAI